MGNFHINNPKFALATKLCNDSKLQNFANPGYYAVGGNYRQWNGSTFVSLGLETCDDFGSTSLPLLTGSSTSSLSFSSEVLSSGDVNGGTTVLSRGFVYCRINFPDPVAGGAGVTSVGFQGGEIGNVFNHTAHNLDLNQLYKVRSYATNNIGTNYSEVEQMRTLNSTQGNYCFSNSNALTACTTCESSQWNIVGSSTINQNTGGPRGFAYKSGPVNGSTHLSACSASSTYRTNLTVFTSKDVEQLEEGVQLFTDVEKSTTLDNSNGSYTFFKYSTGLGDSSGPTHNVIQINNSGVITLMETC